MYSAQTIINYMNNKTSYFSMKQCTLALVPSVSALSMGCLLKKQSVSHAIINIFDKVLTV